MAYKEVSVKQPLLLTILPYVSIIIFFAFWEGVVRSGIIPNTLLASPSQVFAAFIDKLSNPNPDGAIMATHAWTSIQEAFIGYVLSLVVGIPLGLAMGWFNVVEGLFRPIFELIRPIPIAWIPLTVFWFGIGLAGKVFIIWIAGIVPCVINSYVGVRMTNPTLIQMARTYGANNWQIFTQLCIPSALPMVFGALQLALAYCWTNLVAAELLAADSGLGFLITMGGRLGRPDIIVLGMICVGLSGAVIGFIIDQIERNCWLASGGKRHDQFYRQRNRRPPKTANRSAFTSSLPTSISSTWFPSSCSSPWGLRGEREDLRDSPARPLEVVDQLYRLTYMKFAGTNLIGHIWASTQRVLIGFIAASVVAVPLGLFMALNKYVNAIVKPLFDLFKPMPPIAWVSIAILWFGIGEMSKVFIIIIGTFVPCLLNAYNGVRLVDPDLYDVIRVLGGKRRDEIFHVCFPASFPAVFAGLQISLSSAWTCVLAAELMNSRDGMGFLIKRGMDTHQPTLVLGGMVLIAAAAYGTSLLVTLFEGKLCPWKRTIENL
ncbi:MAG: ABC transporter permease [Bilophila wadsworthia]